MTTEQIAELLDGWAFDPAWYRGATTGSWSRNDWPQPDGEIRIGATGTPRIATVHLRDVSINEQKANTHLIADAPRLFALCLAQRAEIARLRAALDQMAAALREVPKDAPVAYSCAVDALGAYEEARP